MVEAIQAPVLSADKIESLVSVAVDSLDLGAQGGAPQATAFFQPLSQGGLASQVTVYDDPTPSNRADSNETLVTFSIVDLRGSFARQEGLTVLLMCLAMETNLQGKPYGGRESES